MAEQIDELVSVHFFSNHSTHIARPVTVYWRGRVYQITNVGLHHTVRDGRTVLHMFSVTDGNTFFKLQLDTESLQWRLLEIDTN